MADASAPASAPGWGRARLAELVHAPAAQVSLASLVLVAGVVLASANLDRGVWHDEFVTLFKTAPGVSLADFARYLAREQHPIGHYGLAYVARQLGLESVVALRALNLLGVPLVLAGLRHAQRRGALSVGQACVVAMVYASSPIFFAYAAELRAYFLAYAASIAVACAWLVVCTRPLARGDLRALGLTLLVYCNLQYFALPLAGLLTTTACLALRRRGARRDALRLALTSALAAAPALALWLVQARVTFAAGKMAHLGIATHGVLRTMQSIARDALGRNGAVYLLVPLALFAIVRGRRPRAHHAALLVLGALVLALYGALAVGAQLAPILAERYLVVPAGAITVLAALAVGPGAPRFGVVLVAIAALAMQARILVRAPYREAHWHASAAAVAAEVRACSTTRVLAAVLVDHTRDPEEAVDTWRTGYRYYAGVLGFSIAELQRGEVVHGGSACPSVIWIEHAWKTASAPLPEVLRELEVTTRGVAELRRVGSGLLVLVR